MNNKQKVYFFSGMFSAIKRDMHDAGLNIFQPIQNAYREILDKLKEEDKVICKKAFALVIEDEI